MKPFCRKQALLTFTCWAGPIDSYDELYKCQVGSQAGPKNSYWWFPVPIGLTCIKHIYSKYGLKWPYFPITHFQGKIGLKIWLAIIDSYNELYKCQVRSQAPPNGSLAIEDPPLQGLFSLNGYTRHYLPLFLCDISQVGTIYHNNDLYI